MSTNFMMGLLKRIAANVKGLPPADEINDLSSLIQPRLAASIYVKA
jgi:hypothetical protein